MDSRASSFVERDHCIHNDEFECATCVDERHLVEHPERIDGCRFCKFVEGIQLSPKATPSKRSLAPPRRPDPAWERGIVKDHRGVPLLKADGSEIGVKEYSQRRREIEAARKQLAQTPAPTKE